MVFLRLLILGYNRTIIISINSKQRYEMKITALVENTTRTDDFETEHGLSLYIETANHRILFDMGQSDLFLKNAEKLGIDLKGVDIAILSHGHYDHSGGLVAFLELNKTAPVYLSRFAFEPHYNGSEKYIGIDPNLQDNPRLIYVEDSLVIDEELSLYSQNNKEKHYDLGSFGLNTLEDGVLVPDDFRHEHYLLIKENTKTVVISGCSHKGILDITRWFAPSAIVGGFHFSKLPLDSTLAKYAAILNSYSTHFYTCHCTGVPQYEFMKQYMSKLSYLSTADTIEI